jgi:hypothetical protein
MKELIGGTVAEAETAVTKAPGAAKKKGVRGARRPRAATSVAKADSKSGKGKNTSIPAPRAKRAGATKTKKSPQNNKTDKIFSLLRQPNGASLKEIMKATGWQAHSVRGFISGTLRKKMSLAIVSSRSSDGERCYSIKA